MMMMMFQKYLVEVSSVEIDYLVISLDLHIMHVKYCQITQPCPGKSNIGKDLACEQLHVGA